MKAKLIESYEITPGVRHFVFEAEEPVEFTPGQFVSLTEVFDGRKITRPYSIVSVPDGSRFDLCLNLVDDGIFSPHLFSMKPGDTVETRTPLGFFVLRNPPSDSILVATGTGIAPFRSILNAHLGQVLRQFTLVFGVRYEQSLMYRGEFEALARQHPNLRFWPVLSRADESWTGRRGHVQPHVQVNRVPGGRGFAPGSQSHGLRAGQGQERTAGHAQLQPL